MAQIFKTEDHYKIFCSLFDTQEKAEETLNRVAKATGKWFGKHDLSVIDVMDFMTYTLAALAEDKILNDLGLPRKENKNA